MHADSARTVFPKLLAYVAMSASGLTGDTVNMLIGSAVHLVVHISMVENTRRVMSIHEVVDTDGISIVSNEVYSYNKRGNQFLSMRGSTAELLASHGFNPSREMSWS
jgi:Flp pilus assembly CpaF family ATPase